MDIICGTKINEIVHYLVLCLQVIIITPHIHHQRGLYLYNMNYYAILKEYLQLIHKIHPKYFLISLDKWSVLKFSLVEINTAFTIRFVLCTYILKKPVKRK